MIIPGAGPIRHNSSAVGSGCGRSIAAKQPGGPHAATPLSTVSTCVPAAVARTPLQTPLARTQSVAQPVVGKAHRSIISTSVPPSCPARCFTRAAHQEAGSGRRVELAGPQGALGVRGLELGDSEDVRPHRL